MSSQPVMVNTSGHRGRDYRHRQQVDAVSKGPVIAITSGYGGESINTSVGVANVNGASGHHYFQSCW